MPAKKKYTSYNQLKDGRWKVRVSSPGRFDRERIAKTKVDAETWANNRLRELGLHGKEGVLQQSETTEYREAKTLARGTDLRDVARYWAEQNPEKPASPVEDVLHAYQSSQQWKDLAKATQSQKGTVLKQFSEHFGKKPVSSVAIEEVENYLDEIPQEVNTA